MIKSHGKVTYCHGKVMEKSWKFIIRFLWEPCMRHFKESGHEGSLEKIEGRFSLKPLKGVGVLSHWRVLLSMMKGGGRGEHGDEVVEWGEEGFEFF